MESLNCLLRRTCVTAAADEVCFMYVPKERIDKSILDRRFGIANVEGDGVTYSLNSSQLQLCFTNQEAALSASLDVHWRISIPPCAERNVVSVILRCTSPVHSARDHVISVYAPERAAETEGMTVVHFWRMEFAENFKQFLSR